MTYRKSGGLFLSMILTEVLILAVEFLLVESGVKFSFGTVGSIILSEAIMIVPAVIVFLLSKEKFTDVFAVQSIHIGTIPMSALYAVLLTPVIMVLNAATLIFQDNEAVDILTSISDISPVAVFLFSSVIAPLVEELTFRGILYSGFRKSGSAMQAIFWTAFLFGIFHGNVNQALYAFAIGIAFGLLREATGSVLPSFFAHFTINAGSSLLILWESSAGAEEFLEQAQMEMADMPVVDAYIGMIGIGTLLAVFTVALALGVLIYISKREFGETYLTGVWERRKTEKGKAVSVALVIGLVCSIALVVLDLIGIL